MKKLLSISLVAVLILGLSVFVWAHGGSNNNYNNGAGHYEQDLNLSHQQEDQLEELEDDYYDQLDDLRDDLWDKREDLRDEYVDKSNKEEYIIELQQEVNQLRNQLFKLQQEYRLEVRDILSSSQLEAMSSYGMFGMGGYRHGRHNGGMYHGPNGQGPQNGHHGPGMMNGF
jgi:uncharacterized protein HemX